MTSAVAPDVRATAGAPARALSRKRSVAVWTLLVVATILLAVMIPTVWVQRQVFDNTAWNRATTNVIQDPGVRASISTFLVNKLYDNVDVEAELQAQLPEQLKGLAPQIAAGLRGPAVSAANAVLSRPRVQQLFIGASSVAHEKLVNVLEDKTGHGITTGNGVVTLNVKPLLHELAVQIGLSGDRIAQIPDDKAQIVLLRSDKLSAAQSGVRAIKVLSAWLIIIVVVLYALAVYLAHGMRRVLLLRIGWCLVLVGAIVLVIRKRLGEYAVDALASPSYKGTIRDVWFIGTAILGQIAIASIAYGILFVLAALLAGPRRWEVAIRRLLAPYLNDYPWFVAGGLAIVYLLVIGWGPTHALRMWWGQLFFAALLAGGFYALRRQTLAEFPHQPDAQPLANP